MPTKPPPVEIPEYLKKKVDRVAEVPMKKIPWNAAIVNILNNFKYNLNYI
jgi:hypothetical protein